MQRDARFRFRTRKGVVSDDVEESVFGRGVALSDDKYLECRRAADDLEERVVFDDVDAERRLLVDDLNVLMRACYTTSLS